MYIYTYYIICKCVCDSDTTSNSKCFWDLRRSFNHMYVCMLNYHLLKDRNDVTKNVCVLSRGNPFTTDTAASACAIESNSIKQYLKENAGLTEIT